MQHKIGFNTTTPAGDPKVSQPQQDPARRPVEYDDGESPVEVQCSGCGSMGYMSRSDYDQILKPIVCPMCNEILVRNLMITEIFNRIFGDAIPGQGPDQDPGLSN